MAEKITRNSWFQDPDNNPRPDCADDLEEIETFHGSDKLPIRASEEFKKNLREKLWKVLKGKYYMVFAFMAFFFC